VVVVVAEAVTNPASVQFF